VSDNGRRNFRARCANCAGGIGIALCTVFMSLSAVGVAAVGLSQGANMAGMGSSSASPVAGGSLLALVIGFFSGLAGEAILIVSFGLMATGMYLGRKLRPMALALVAAVVLFVGMYLYFSLVIIALSSGVLLVAYVAAYNHNFSKFTRLA